MQQSRALAFSSVVLFLVLLVLKGHFGAMPLSWSAASTISVPFAAHMAELHIRHTLASVGRIVSIR